MPEKQTVMIVGRGAREHALSAAYERSPGVARIVMAPGNDFHTWQRDKEVIREPGVDIRNPQTVLDAARHHRVNLVDVAQDDALAAGTVDLLEKNGIRAFGPSRDAAQIEWDKIWSRNFMSRHNIPTPRYRSFSQSNRSAADNYLRKRYTEDPEQLVFVKAAGLCAGKGAPKARSYEEALDRIEQLKEFGEAGASFLIEDGLVGEEFSYYAISDGKSFKTFPSAQDNKLSHDGDRGEQTGGMGATAPVVLTEGHERKIDQQMLTPAIDGLRQEERPYRGILYLGGIITADGLQTIEYNARWGDPESQTILPGLQGDYLALVEAAIAEDIGRAALRHDERTRVCVVGASKGYPGDYTAVRGMEISGLERAAAVTGVTVYGAAVAIRDGRFFADGGRLFNIVAEGSNVREAQERAYEAIEYVSIENDGLHYREDIGDKERDRQGLA